MRHVKNLCFGIKFLLTFEDILFEQYCDYYFRADLIIAHLAIFPCYMLLATVKNGHNTWFTICHEKPGWFWPKIDHFDIFKFIHYSLITVFKIWEWMQCFTWLNRRITLYGLCLLYFTYKRMFLICIFLFALRERKKHRIIYSKQHNGLQ